MPSWPMRRPSKHPHTNTAPGGGAWKSPRTETQQTQQKKRDGKI